MTALYIFALVLLASLVVALYKIQKLRLTETVYRQQIVALQQESEGIRRHYESEAERIHRESQEALAQAQKLLELQIKDLHDESERVKKHYESEYQRIQKHYESESLRIHKDYQEAVANAERLLEQQIKALHEEGERIRQHYGAEVSKAQEAAEGLVARTLKEMEPLRKYESLANAEANAKALVMKALEEAANLRKEAQDLMGQSRAAAAEDRSKALKRSKEIEEQADALLDQATKDAGRIVKEAHNRAEQIGGDAYRALQEKHLLEGAIIAIRNVVEGYGDRYLVPARSLLDDLAQEFGHTSAGEALRGARQQAKRMVEQGEAASCDYAEASRRETAVRFVIDAFNGRVDAVLSRVKHDNYGTLEQEIRDAFNLVNLNGEAFRNAQVLPTYLDARLAELKWATVVQELRLKEREEQRRIQEQMREEEKLRREVERTMKETAKEQEIIRQAMEKAQQQVQHATEEQRLKFEQQLRDLGEKLKEAEERGQRAISQAQQTKLGHVYVISNIGSFGENVFKIGMTRRLAPQDRIDELGDSSVPFEFDVHAFIRCDDAPALEHKLHKHFVMGQVNKVNHRKEFFRVDLKHIREEIEKMGIAAQWTMTSQSAEYRETLAIEEAIKKNPALRDAWVKRQLQLETLDEKLDEMVPETGITASTN